MNVIHDRAEARWLPARFRHATFRLIAFIVIRRSQPKKVGGLVLAIDRDQSALEYYAISIWLLTTLSCYVAEILSPLTSRVVAAAAAVPIAAFAIEWPFFIGGVTAIAFRRLGIGPDNWQRANTAFTYALLIVCTSYFATTQSWIRYVAIFFFAVLMANAVAAIVVWTLRHRIAAVERAYGVAA